jgi:hypothetical protein
MLQAAQYTVTNKNDSGPGSLREAITLANQSSEFDTIVFDSAVTGTILLASDLEVGSPPWYYLPVSVGLEIVGPGSDKLTIQGGGLGISSYYNDVDDTPSTFLVSGLSFVDGGIGIGSIYSRTALELSDVAISGAGVGAGALNPWSGTNNHVTLSIADSTIVGGSGVGVALWGQVDATIRNSTISGHSESGVSIPYYNYGGSNLTIEDSLISENGHTGVNANQAGISVSGTTISNNGEAGFEIGLSSVRLNHSTVSGNGGHGVRAQPLSGVEVVNSTVAMNAGIGIHANGATVINSTISGNKEGGIVGQLEPFYYYGSIEYSVLGILNSTITGNVSDTAAGGVTCGMPPNGCLVQNSVVAGNTAAGGADIDGAVTAKYSLFGNIGSTDLEESVPGSNIIGLDAVLGPLKDNGGPTLTHALLPGSPAIDGGDPGFTPGEFYTYDQRGEGFYRIRNDRVDIGAFEVQSGPLLIGPAWLHSVGDVNKDGTPDIAVTFGIPGFALTTVKDAVSGVRVDGFNFDVNAPPITVKAFRDSDFGEFADGATKLVLLTQDLVETRGLPGGTWGGQVNPSLTSNPLDLAVLPDRNVNGSPELAILGSGPTAVELIDSSTGEKFGRFGFPEGFTPRQVLALPDLNGNSSAEIGVVLTKADDVDRVVIKDSLTKDWIQAVRPSGEYRSFELLQAVLVSDRNSNGAPEVAMLLRDPRSGRGVVWVADAKTNARIATISGFNPTITPIKLVVVADLDRNRIEEFALLGLNTRNGEVTAEIRDGARSALVSRIRFGRSCIPLDMATINDVNGNGSEELVILGRCEAEGSLTAFVRDAKNGEFVRRIDF